MLILFLSMNFSISAVSINIFLLPGNLTTRISPAQILFLMAQVVNPRYLAASLKSKRRGVKGCVIPCAFCDPLPVWLVLAMCLYCAQRDYRFESGTLTGDRSNVAARHQNPKGGRPKSCPFVDTHRKSVTFSNPQFCGKAHSMLKI